MTALGKPDRSQRNALAALIDCIPEFDGPDRMVALELVDAALAGSPDYELLADAQSRAYLCFGPTPMTRGTYDLYWIAVHPAARRAGLGAALIGELERTLRQRGARLVRVETASSGAYDATRKFYPRMGYREEARLRDFYKPGDDLVIYLRRL
ncbi:MAG TPA: GNAT family N-acetyltransferase [Myxococcales bacterium]|nr:GNAT family N-acetyltransferase [Myxococcales bacterium]